MSRLRHFQAGITIAIMVLVVVLVLQGVTGPELREYANDASEWCDSHDGELINARVIGPHGGLHCELPNGTSVHMDEVLASENTANSEGKE